MTEIKNYQSKFWQTESPLGLGKSFFISKSKLWCGQYGKILNYDVKGLSR